MTDPNREPEVLGPNNLGVEIVYMGGVEDTRVRPLSEFLRELREEAEKDPERKLSPPRENGETGPNQQRKLLGPNSRGIDIMEAGGEEDTRVRPLSEFLRELREQAERRDKENGETRAP